MHDTLQWVWVAIFIKAHTICPSTFFHHTSVEIIKCLIWRRADCLLCLSWSLFATWRGTLSYVLWRVEIVYCLTHLCCIETLRIKSTLIQLVFVFTQYFIFSLMILLLLKYLVLLNCWHKNASCCLHSYFRNEWFSGKLSLCPSCFWHFRLRNSLVTTPSR